MSRHTLQPQEHTLQKRPFYVHRAFALLWSGQAVSEFGSYITGSALQLLAVLVLLASPVQMGWLAFLSALPILLFGFVAGVWVDRLPRRLTMIVCDLARALLLLSIPLAALLHWLRIEQIYAIVVLLSCFGVFFEVARRALLPTLVQPEQLVKCNSKLEASNALAEIVGPTCAGGLVQLITAPFAIIVDVCSFLFSALCLVALREERTIMAGVERAVRLREVLAGAHFLFTHPTLRVLAWSELLRGFFGGAFAALYTLYVIRELHVPPLWYGILTTIGGCGALLGALLAGRVSKYWKPGQLLTGTLLIDSLFSVLTPLAMGPLIIAQSLLLLGQLGSDSVRAIFVVNEVSLRQKLVPEHLQGRVHACMHLLTQGIGPLGALLAGWLSLFVGTREMLWVGALGMVSVAVFAYLSPLRKLTL